MDWNAWIWWQLDPDFNLAPEVGAQDRREDCGALTATDHWLIQTIYEALAPTSRCKKCLARLGRRTHVLPSADVTPSGGRLVVTACHGWRHHRHAASVAYDDGDVIFGEFHLDER